MEGAKASSAAIGRDVGRKKGGYLNTVRIEPLDSNSVYGGVSLHRLPVCGTYAWRSRTDLSRGRHDGYKGVLLGVFFT